MKLPAQCRNPNRSILLRISFAICCVIVLSLAPQPSFAQHGGGGGGSHGGGSSGGGHSGGGGGGHASGGGHSGPAFGSGGGSGGGVHVTGGATHSSGASVAASNAPSGGSHIWAGSGAGSSTSSAHVERFAAGNNVWQDPPSARGGPAVNSTASARANTAAQKNSVVASSRLFVARAPSRGPLLGNTQTPRPPIVFNPRHHHHFDNGDFFFFGGGCFGGFFPGFCGSGLWWGPGYGYGWGPGCDPVLGCTGYGYSNYGLDSYNNMQVESDTPSQEYGPFRWQDSEAPDSAVDRADARAASKPAASIYLRDGSSYGVTDYWLTGGELHYITNYGGENSIPADRLDLQRTVDENAALGVNFILSNQPSPRE